MCSAAKTTIRPAVAAGIAAAVFVAPAAMVGAILMSITGGVIAGGGCAGDSLGLFQQRPSQGWGSPADILNPRRRPESSSTTW